MISSFNKTEFNQSIIDYGKYQKYILTFSPVSHGFVKYVFPWFVRI